MRSIAVNVAVIIVLLCAPVFLGGLAWGFYLISTVAPLWVFIIIGLSAFVVALGFASLLDQRNPLPPPPRRDR